MALISYEEFAKRGALPPETSNKFYPYFLQNDFNKIIESFNKYVTQLTKPEHIRELLIGFMCEYRTFALKHPEKYALSLTKSEKMLEMMCDLDLPAPPKDQLEKARKIYVDVLTAQYDKLMGYNDADITQYIELYAFAIFVRGGFDTILTNGKPWGGPPSSAFDAVRLEIRDNHFMPKPDNATIMARIKAMQEAEAAKKSAGQSPQ